MSPSPASFAVAPELVADACRSIPTVPLLPIALPVIFTPVEASTSTPLPVLLTILLFVMEVVPDTPLTEMPFPVLPMAVVPSTPMSFALTVVLVPPPSLMPSARLPQTRLLLTLADVLAARTEMPMRFGIEPVPARFTPTLFSVIAFPLLMLLN